MTKPRELLGLREYARRRGCSHVAVSKAIARGRLVESVHEVSQGTRRVRKVDPDVADREWELNTDVRRAPPEARAPAPGMAPVVQAEAAAEVDAATDKAAAANEARRARAPKQRLAFGDKPSEPMGGRSDEDVERAAVAGQLRKAQAVRTTAAAKLDHLRAERLAGSLVDLRGVEREAAQLGATLQDAFRSVGGRIADLLAAESDPSACEKLVNDEVARVLENYVRHQLVAAGLAES